jgi:hypothetical protein
MTTPAQRLAADLGSMHKRLTAVERGSQLTFSTIEVSEDTDLVVSDALDAGVSAAADVAVIQVDVEDTQARIDEAETVLAETGADLDVRLAEAETALDEAQERIDAIELDGPDSTKLLFSTEPPSGAARQGSTWFQVDEAGGIIGQWQQTGEGVAEVWTKRDVRSEAIANLDVGKLIAGDATIGELVAQRIAAATASFQTVDIANLFVTGQATINEAVIEKLFADVVRAKIIAADEFIGGNAIITGTLTGDKIAANALAGATIVGGYIESPVIASSAKLGTGANVLTDPDFASQIDTDWVASGHTGDGTTVTRQTDTITWDKTWTMTGYGGSTGSRRNYGSVVVDTDLAPVDRRPGTVTLSNRSFFDTAARSVSNPYPFVNLSNAAGFSGPQFGGRYDPTFSRVGIRTKKADAAATTYLTNQSQIALVAGEPWAVRLEHAALGAKADFVQARIEIIDATTAAVIWERALTHDELAYGTAISAAFTPTVSATARFRVAATYTAAGGGVTRKVRSGFARLFSDGQEMLDTTKSTMNQSVPNAAGMHVAAPAELYGSGALASYPSLREEGSFLPQSNDANTKAIVARSEVHWYVTRAILSQVEPEKGWALDKESGLRLFSSSGAQTGQIDGETNFLAGRFATAAEGERLELDGGFLTWYDANGNPLRRYGRDGGEVRSGGAWIPEADDSGWLTVGATGAPPFASGWSGYTSGWDGLQIRKMGGQVTIAGVPTKTSFAAGETIFTLPTGWAPATRIRFFGSNDGSPKELDVMPTGALLTRFAGSATIAFSVSFPAQ